MPMTNGNVTKWMKPDSRIDNIIQSVCFSSYMLSALGGIKAVIDGAVVYRKVESIDHS